VSECVIRSNDPGPFNQGGLQLNGDAGYALNELTCNENPPGCTNATQVNGGIDLGENVCGTDTTCP
jgi:hypothetical protein